MIEPVRRGAAAVIVALGLGAAGCDDGGGGGPSGAGGADAGGGACPAGAVDADGDPANGCECTPDGDERCNGRDDDCDREVDEGLGGEVCSECGAARCRADGDGAALVCEEPDDAGVALADTGLVIPVAGLEPPGVAVDAAGDLLVGVAGTPPRLWRIPAGGGPPEEISVATDVAGRLPAIACGAEGCVFAWWRGDGERPGVHWMATEGGEVAFRGLGTDFEPAHGRWWLSAVDGRPVALLRMATGGRVDLLTLPLVEGAEPTVILSRLALDAARLVPGAGTTAVLEETGGGMAWYPAVDLAGGERVRDPAWSVAGVAEVVALPAGDGFRLVWRDRAGTGVRHARLDAEGGEIEAPAGVDWDVGSLTAADNRHSVWVAGSARGAAATVPHRRRATTGDWLPPVELDFEPADTAIQSVTLAADPARGAVWLVITALQGGDRALRIGRYDPVSGCGG